MNFFDQHPDYDFESGKNKRDDDIQPVYDPELGKYRTPNEQEIEQQLEEKFNPEMAEAKKRANEVLLKSKAFHLVISDDQGNVEIIQDLAQLNALEIKGFASIVEESIGGPPDVFEESPQKPPPEAPFE